MGRKPKPIAELKFTGNYRKDRQGQRALIESSVDTIDTLEPPSDISPLSRELFTATIEPLLLRGLIAQQDVAQLYSSAYLLHNYYLLRDRLSQATDLKDQLAIIGAMNKTLTAYSSIMYHYFVTPSERAKLASTIQSAKTQKTIQERLRDAKKSKDA